MIGYDAATRTEDPAGYAESAPIARRTSARLHPAVVRRRLIAASRSDRVPGDRRRCEPAGSGAAYENDAQTAEFSWRVPLPSPGQYELAVWYPAAEGQTAGAIYSVRSPVIAPLMTYDQRRWNARWLPLGTIDSAGQELVVTVRNAGTGTLVADALRIIALQPSAMAAPRSSSSARSTER
jgi:hypothetical protein